MLESAEKDFLADGDWIAGRQCTLADIHANWMIKWALHTIGVSKEPGFSKEDFPKVYKW